MELSNRATLSPELFNPLHITLAVSGVQLVADLFSVLSKDKSLRAEVNDVPKAPKATSFPLFLRHIWIKGLGGRR